MIELYHFWSSVCSVKARMCLEEKGIDWTSRYTDIFKFEQLTPEYLALNPGGVVPTLVHDGKPVRESSIICEYIDEAFEGPTLTPKDPILRARMREFMRACDDGLPAIALPTMVKYVMPKLRNRWGDEELRKRAAQRPTQFLRDFHKQGVEGTVTDAEMKQAFEKLEHLLDNMEGLLTEYGPWVVGDFSLADIAVAPYLFRLSALGEDRFWSMGSRPHLADWYGRMQQRPAFQAAVSWPDEGGGGYSEVGLHEAREDVPTNR